ncbi:hypothetical protein B0A51_18947, partial [Rachicladosporium sp. CCFEE 5018]
LGPQDGYGSIDALRYCLWLTIIDVAAHIPYTDPGQSLLIQILETLDLTSGWEGLPGLGQQMREDWNHDPTFNRVWGSPHPHDYTLDQWINVSSFAARVQSASLVTWINFAVWQLRAALEENWVVAENADTKVAVACEWIVHSGQRILQLCLQEREMGETALRSEGPGILFAGLPGTNLERWGFWTRRLKELRGQVCEAVHMSVDQALEAIRSAEAKLSGPAI